ncbi:MAG: hypothetical protein IPK11_05910 [Ignavibacteria bacterium]|nr:hypothetical protein [Ignavibacteria bacterium]
MSLPLREAGITVLIFWTSNRFNHGNKPDFGFHTSVFIALAVGMAL